MRYPLLRMRRQRIRTSNDPTTLEPCQVSVCNIFFQTAARAAETRKPNLGRQEDAASERQSPISVRLEVDGSHPRGRLSSVVRAGVHAKGLERRGAKRPPHRERLAAETPPRITDISGLEDSGRTSGGSASAGREGRKRGGTATALRALPVLASRGNLSEQRRQHAPQKGPNHRAV